MVFKRQEHDVVLARFFIGGNSLEAIRFIKRRGKFYRVDDIQVFGPDRHTIDTITEIEPLKMIELINAALNATMNGEGETYEIWINHWFHSELYGK